MFKQYFEEILLKSNSYNNLIEFKMIIDYLNSENITFIKVDYPEKDSKQKYARFYIKKDDKYLLQKDVWEGNTKYVSMISDLDISKYPIIEVSDDKKNSEFIRQIYLEESFYMEGFTDSPVSKPNVLNFLKDYLKYYKKLNLEENKTKDYHKFLSDFGFTVPNNWEE